MKVVVTGAAGQLGQAIVARFSAAHEVVALTRADLDLGRHHDVMRIVGGSGAGVVVNCAAYNHVDQAEEDVAGALDGNAFAVRSLARAAAQAGATFVHYSTDFVFDGETERPYTEEDAPRPKSVYGQSKLLGEWFALDAGGVRPSRGKPVWRPEAAEQRGPDHRGAGVGQGRSRIRRSDGVAELRG